MDKQDNFLVNKFLKQISKIIDHKLEKLTTVESAIVDQVNIDGSVNLHIPPDSTIFTGVQNQSIYQNLKVGDCVKVLKQNNKASNMWIIGGHNLKRDDTVEKINETVSNMIDFIVEQGNSGIWAYRKWNSGIAECWGTIPEITITGCETWGSIYIADGVIPEQTYPFNFIEIPKCTITPKLISYNFWIYPFKKGTVSNTGKYSIARGTDASNFTVQADLYVIGKWK